jgi:cysteine desulfurase
MKRVYLDHTATTPLDERVLDAMMPYFAGTFGNASSVHWYGRQAKLALEQARATIAQAIDAQPGEVFFTSGGTESDNFAIRGVAMVAGPKGRRRIVTSKTEHHAVLEPCDRLSEEGFEIAALPVDECGIVRFDDLHAAMTPTTAIVSIMHANNETGSIAPVRALADLAHESGALFHTDAVQSLGKIPVSVADLGVDLMSLSAHKLYGPKGIGALYIRRGTEIDSLLHGGGQERGRRPGTENVPLAVGFAKAIELALHEMQEESNRLRTLRDRLEKEICASFPAAIINGHPVDRLPQILNVSFDSGKMKLEGETLVMNMDMHGIAVTSGSACTSGSMQPSHVLLAMGRDEETAKATLRFAFGRGNAGEDVSYVVECLKEIFDRMSR